MALFILTDPPTKIHCHGVFGYIQLFCCWQDSFYCVIKTYSFTIDRFALMIVRLLIFPTWHKLEMGESVNDKKCSTNHINQSQVILHQNLQVLVHEPNVDGSDITANRLLIVEETGVPGENRDRKRLDRTGFEPSH